MSTVGGVDVVLDFAPLPLGALWGYNCASLLFTSVMWMSNSR